MSQVSQVAVRNTFIFILVVQLAIIVPTFFDLRGIIEFERSINWFLKHITKNYRLFLADVAFIIVAFTYFRNYTHIPATLALYDFWQSFVLCSDYGAIDKFDSIVVYITWFLYGTLWIFIIHFLLVQFYNKKGRRLPWNS